MDTSITIASDILDEATESLLDAKYSIDNPIENSSQKVYLFPVALQLFTIVFVEADEVEFFYLLILCFNLVILS